MRRQPCLPGTPGCPAIEAVDCAGSWGDWSTCSAECGGGSQQKAYTVTAAAVGAGQACPTDSPRKRACNEAACTVESTDGAVLEATLDLASLGDPLPTDPAVLQARFAAEVAAALGVLVGRIEVVGVVRVQVPFVLRAAGDGRRAV